MKRFWFCVILAALVGCSGSGDKMLKLELLREKEKTITRELDDWKAKKASVVANYDKLTKLKSSIGEGVDAEAKKSHDETVSSIDEMVTLKQEDLDKVRAEISEMSK